MILFFTQLAFSKIKRSLKFRIPKSLIEFKLPLMRKMVSGVRVAFSQKIKYMNRSQNTGLNYNSLELSIAEADSEHKVSLSRKQ